MRNRAFSFHVSEGADRALSFPASGVQIALPELRQWAEGWMLECEMARHSAQTLTNRRFLLDKLFWFHEDRKLTICSTHTLRMFLLYAGSASETGRWNNPHSKRETKPGSVATFHRMLSALFNWIVDQEGLPASPMAKIKPPVDRPDQIQPFSTEQVQALLQAARRSEQPRRNEAIIYLLLDTGMRVSELCSLRMKDVDMIARRLRFEGKGGKERTQAIGKAATRALWHYLKESDGTRTDDSPLILAEGGWKTGEAMTNSGIQQLLRKLGRAADIKNVRCSPHTFRHTFAIEFLKAGGNQFTLMQMLGHTDVKQTARYVLLAQADIEAQHRLFSPGDRLKRKK